MSIGHSFRKADRLLKKMPPGDRDGLLPICHELREAQAGLLAAAAKPMKRCIERCAGMCCRNIELDPIISHWDLLFILALAPQTRSEIQHCLLKEDPLYRTDCIFLRGGIGPCIFPDTVRPEVCVTTFCENDRPVRREIRRVKRLFFRLAWFVRWRGVRWSLRAGCLRVFAAASRTFGTIPGTDGK